MIATLTFCDWRQEEYKFYPVVDKDNILNMRSIVLSGFKNDIQILISSKLFEQMVHALDKRLRQEFCHTFLKLLLLE